jgi:hypothetical protein
MRLDELQVLASLLSGEDGDKPKSRSLERQRRQQKRPFGERMLLGSGIMNTPQTQGPGGTGEGMANILFPGAAENPFAVPAYTPSQAPAVAQANPLTPSPANVTANVTAAAGGSRRRQAPAPAPAAAAPAVPQGQMEGLPLALSDAGTLMAPEEIPGMDVAMADIEAALSSFEGMDENTKGGLMQTLSGAMADPALHLGLIRAGAALAGGPEHPFGAMGMQMADAIEQGIAGDLMSRVMAGEDPASLMASRELRALRPELQQQVTAAMTSQRREERADDEMALRTRAQEWGEGMDMSKLTLAQAEQQFREWATKEGFRQQGIDREWSRFMQENQHKFQREMQEAGFEHDWAMLRTKLAAQQQVTKKDIPNLSGTEYRQFLDYAASTYGDRIDGITALMQSVMGAPEGSTGLAAFLSAAPQDVRDELLEDLPLLEAVARSGGNVTGAMQVLRQRRMAGRVPEIPVDSQGRATRAGTQVGERAVIQGQQAEWNGQRWIPVTGE